jgi:hypothetical protein
MESSPCVISIQLLKMKLSNTHCEYTLLSDCAKPLYVSAYQSEILRHIFMDQHQSIERSYT